MFQRCVYLCGKQKNVLRTTHYLVYKEKEYASKDGGNCTSYLKIQ